LSKKHYYSQDCDGNLLQPVNLSKRKNNKRPFLQSQLLSRHGCLKV